MSGFGREVGRKLVRRWLVEGRLHYEPNGLIPIRKFLHRYVNGSFDIYSRKELLRRELGGEPEAFYEI
ncbi:hypothetical protein COU62_03405 [Candidatus Pacearchaeota archaeon CG10_big_fil_rev_8_21_14_0_10_35_219]|nr:MAG: hypothetical protein AUJ63_03755 [Candidatus Pacearchaeota archaeon CG1_02_35_32]PIO07401.1 MAG: hypothetical protein COU62_03405 [Candidatus Pacearchaeota archaeon CG10_big_fil_rev_8_21_14_0_10_35_219]PIY81671.1 MAG: hypothetical protein COY79_01185 [Candidatus Pacearchaeota archaeon CG_4_10_14_0_8_um_filter_35_169]PIZ80137.1 MAG: hypothetical protein COY00_01560 [Candidatus Pacearchaeota archaeon CG_4_10_14_0_2_um_filter_35_33]PJA69599.1 MAG: hypothetical protein CO155_04990 [Candidat